MTNKGFLAILLVFLTACAQTFGGLESEVITQRFFVATTGVDTNPGTLTQPLRTIQKCATVATPGTACFIRAGTYRETVKPTNSGQSGLPILFRPYNNETVLISGANVVRNWTVDSGSVYKAPVTWNLGLGNNQVFVDGKMMIEARYPNAGLDLFAPWGKFQNPTGSNVTYTILASNLPSGLNGANINFLPGPEWVPETGTITSATSTQFTFTSPGGQMEDIPDFDAGLYVPKDGNPYFIWGKKVLLDSASEWFLDSVTSNTGQLYLWTTQSDNPSNHTVEAKRREYAFDLRDRSYIRVEGIHIFAATIITGNPENPDAALSSNIILKNIHVRYPSHFTKVTPGFSWSKGMTDSGLILFGKNHQLLESSIAFSAGNGVTLAGSNHRITNTIIHDIDYTATDTSAITTGLYGDYSSRGHLIQNNTLYNAGRSMVVHRETQALKILNNHLYNAGLLASDLGMTYTFTADGRPTDGGGTEIAYNLVHDNFAPGEGMGIYLDNGSKNFIVHHNIVWNVKNALNLNLPSINNRIYNNTLLSWYEAAKGGAARLPQCDATGTKLINNIFGGPTNFGYMFAGGDCPAGTVLPIVQDNLEYSINPNFVNTLENNYALQAASPAIDVGRLLGSYTNGYTGASPDLGALEFSKTPFTAGATITEPCVYGDPCLPPSTLRYGVKAEYFSDESLSTFVSQRGEPTFDFGYYDDTASPPGTYLPSGANYSARWTGYLKAPVTGRYTFTLTADDGARMWLNNVQRVNRWEYRDPPIDTFNVNLQAGTYYLVKVEMRQGTGGGQALLEWAYPGQVTQTIPLPYLTLSKP
jgi:PA14 domain/Right handed beta helix region